MMTTNTRHSTAAGGDSNTPTRLLKKKNQKFPTYLIQPLFSSLLTKRTKAGDLVKHYLYVNNENKLFFLLADTEVVPGSDKKHPKQTRIQDLFQKKSEQPESSLMQVDGESSDENGSE
jgi:hypothetical protein